MRQDLVPGKEKRKNKRHSAGKYQQFAAMEFAMTPRLHASLMQSLMPLEQVVKGTRSYFLVNLSRFF
jgi:exopolysaccharide biosynthesis predicted pyruvyltransferase EpsI